jgi:type VI secretion system protein ImpA
MPLPEGLLNPIAGPNPSGQNLRYDPVYDKIKEARREEDELPQGEWQYEVKKADYSLVSKLTTDALLNKSKDLQLAAWLTEALLAREGFAGLQAGLELLRGLVEQFWDTLYPEIEDDDLGVRSAPLEWVGTFLAGAATKVPLTRGGLDFLKYKESRKVGYEQDCAGNESKLQARETAKTEGKVTAEEFDAQLNATSTEFYQGLVAGLEGALASVQSLETFCDQKFGRDAPSFGKLKTALEEVQQPVRQFLKSKQPVEPEVAEVAAEEPAAEAGAAAAPARKPAVQEEPVDAEDAVRRIALVARYLRQQDPLSPVPYLILRGLRWGELRASGASPDPALLEPPPSQTRQQLKRLALDSQWAELLEAGELVMSTPSGRAWLDLQRYVVKACEELGSSYEPIAKAVLAELRVLLADLPEFPQWTFADDTPVANPETQSWLHERVLQPQSAGLDNVMPVERKEQEAGGPSERAVPDAQELAMQAVRAGHTEEAIAILTREAAQERSERARFQRRTQLAALCLTIGQEAVAYPILQELAEEIERRKLYDWEAPEVVAHPLTLLFRCLHKLNGNVEERQKVYRQICRLDPVQALALK